MVHVLYSEWLVNKVYKFKLDLNRRTEGFTIVARPDTFLYIFDDSTEQLIFANVYDLLTEFSKNKKNCDFKASFDGEFVQIKVKDLSNSYMLKTLESKYGVFFVRNDKFARRLSNLFGNTINFSIFGSKGYFGVYFNNDLLFKVTDISVLKIDKKFIRYWIEDNKFFISFDLGLGISTTVTSIWRATVVFVIDMTNGNLLDFVAGNISWGLDGYYEYCYKSSTQAMIVMSGEDGKVFNGVFKGMLSRSSVSDNW